MAGLKEHIFLIGFMGCGKSTNAARLAEMTGARQVEMDQMIVENEGMAIADIFEEKGEAYFRELETELIKQKGPVAIARATATVDGKVAATAELTVAIG